MKEQLLDTWRIHNKMNCLLMDNTSDDGMLKTLSSRGGRTVYLQWVHIHHVRMQWLEICARDLFSAGSGGKKYTGLDKEAAMDRKALRKAFDDSAKCIEELLSRSWDDGGKVKGFKKGIIPLLGYFITHESHHRGNMLLTLKQSGEKIPDTIKWGLWEWGK